MANKIVQLQDGSGNNIYPVGVSYKDYSDFTGATSSAAGENGLVPAPAAGNQNSFLKGDGTWTTDTGWIHVPDSGSSGTNNGLLYRVKNGICYLNAMSWTSTNYWSGDTSTFTLPTAAWPSRRLGFVGWAYTSSNSYALAMAVDPDGYLHVWNSGSVSLVNIGFSISYPVDN